MMRLPAFTSAPARNAVYNVDCFELLRAMPDASVDAIVTDPPYNLTNLDFERAIDWQAFWVQARRVLVSKVSPIIMFSQQPFTTDLINSNRKAFRYELIWEKTNSTGFLDANRRPLRIHENILIFGDGLPDYTPQMQFSQQKYIVRSNAAAHYGKHVRVSTDNHGTRYPDSIWKFANGSINSLHPTAKPLPLMERLIMTYTEPDWLIVDPFAGSGSTLLAAANLGRDYIGCDVSLPYVETARKRLAQPYTLPLFAAAANA